MKSLRASRKKINRIDRKMLSLFKRRMKVSGDIAEYKAKNRLPVYDGERESEMLFSAYLKAENGQAPEEYPDFVKNMLTLSKRHQKNLLSDGDVFVNVGEGYPVSVKCGALTNIKNYFSLDRKVLVVTDPGVPKYYISAVVSACKNAYTYVLKSGEASKSIENVKEILSYMSENGFDRHDCIVAVGGGVVGDIAGLCASLYMRGIDFYNVPTTLLAMADASVGGKTAVNLDGFKNTVGTFYHPSAVLIDPRVLLTLPTRHLRNGVAEIIKIAATSDKALFDAVKDGFDMQKAEEIITSAVKAKAKTVALDEKESGKRRVLNFGHTLGHAIEYAKNGELLHGECVALGMLPMCLNEEVKQKLETALKNNGLDTETVSDAELIARALEHDKKSDDGKITVIRLESIGSYTEEKLTREEILTLYKENCRI